MIFYEIQTWNDDSLQIGSKDYRKAENAIKAFREIKKNRQGDYYYGGEKIDMNHVYDSDCIDKDITFIDFEENIFIELRKIEINFED